MYYLLNEFEDQEINYRHDTFYAPISLISINCAFIVIYNFTIVIVPYICVQKKGK